MIKTPKNYEEAKIFLKGDKNNQVIEQKKKLLKIRMALIPALFITAIGTASEILLGMGLNGFLMSIPLSILTSFLPELLAYMNVKKLEKSINDNSFFEENTEEQVISKANDQIEFYNEAIDKKEGKRK